jgi:Na+-transporting NADH:ubiquinone oxidoreductase subunit NqrD
VLDLCAGVRVIESKNSHNFTVCSCKYVTHNVSIIIVVIIIIIIITALNQLVISMDLQILSKYIQFIGQTHTESLVPVLYFLKQKR